MEARARGVMVCMHANTPHNRPRLAPYCALLCHTARHLVCVLACATRTMHALLFSRPCREGVIDREHDMIVCPISGRTLERLLTECEVRALQGREAGEEEEGCEVHDDAADFAGFVGRAFERGYSCSDEKELRRVCGVRLR